MAEEEHEAEVLAMAIEEEEDVDRAIEAYINGEVRERNVESRYVMFPHICIFPSYLAAPLSFFIHSSFQPGQ